jgi:uncharacterized protein
VIWWFLFGRRAPDPGMFLPEEAARHARYRRWLWRSWVLFGLPSLATLIVAGLITRAGWLTGMPHGFLPVTAALGGFIDRAELVQGVLVGCASGGVLLALAFAVQRWRGRPPPGPIGNVAALMPRRLADLPYGALLAVSAGITEELFFRLSLPLLVVLAGGGIWLGVGLATLLFGAVHRYQGWRGMIATGIVGAVFAGLYAVAGALWLPMLAHAAMDVVALVGRPILAGALKRR